MDENGDAEGNYTLIGLMEDAKSPGIRGLFPMGTLTRKQHNDSALPVNINRKKRFLKYKIGVIRGSVRIRKRYAIKPCVCEKAPSRVVNFSIRSSDKSVCESAHKQREIAFLSVEFAISENAGKFGPKIKINNSVVM